MRNSATKTNTANKAAVDQAGLDQKELPSYPVTIGGKTYKLCFDFDELCKSQDAFNRAGYGINLLYALDVARADPRSMQILFAAAVRPFHPELNFEAACKLVTIGSFYVVVTAILNAFAESKELAFPLASPEASTLQEAR